MLHRVKIASLFILGLLLAGGAYASPVQDFSPFPRKFPSPITYQVIKVGKIPVNVVRVDLNSAQIGVRLYVASEHASHHRFPHEAFPTMIAKAHPTAAIDGTYYDTKTYKSVGTLVSDGELLELGNHGIAVCFDEKNRLSFVKVKNWKKFSWKMYKVVLATGPTLIEHGHVHVYPRAERFRDPSLFRPARRSALGVTKDNHLILVAIQKRILFRDLAWIMKQIGAVKAVALDGGASTALYYRGDYMIHPGRILTNILIIDEQREMGRQEAALPKP